MLPMAEQVSQDFDFGFVGRADECRIVSIERNFTDVAPVGIIRDRIHDAHTIVTRDTAAFLALYPISDDNHPHRELSRPPVIDNS
jgi:hypothetical protein